MNILRSKSQLERILCDFKDSCKSIGLVPTMGALHLGHGALVRKAIEENDTVVVSIFVNPTQFDNPDDLNTYPRALEEDAEFLKNISEEIIIFSPRPEDIYSGNIVSDRFDFNGLDVAMEGRYRVGHFDGVATIVKKLLDLVKPDRAYFGEKDFQQLAIVKQMVVQTRLPVKIVAVPIYREADGLAMSSRNTRLNDDLREAAPFIFKMLNCAKKKFGTESAESITEWVENQFNQNTVLKLEYFVIADSQTLKPIESRKNKSYRAFIAAYAGDVRLIDNIALN